MDLDKLVAIIPDLLLYFIPGFIIIRMKTYFVNEEKRDNFDTVLFSVLYSFIVGVVYEMLRSLYQITIRDILFFNDILNIFNRQIMKSIIMLILSVISTVLMIKIPKFKWWLKVSEQPTTLKGRGF